jgi:adenosine deaminase
LKERQIPIEVCPTSNYRTGVVPKGAPHPILTMIEAGLNVTVNSDDPPMFGTSLTEEYREVVRWGASAAQFRTVVHATTLACFSDGTPRT